MSKVLRFAPVSVIIPCYKASAFLERAIHSVINQTLLPKEIILIDDASPDGGKTRECIKKITESVLIKRYEINTISIFLDKNIGPGGSRNTGWEVATQDWIAFLDADDAWDINKIALQYRCIEIESSIDLIAHHSSMIKSDLRLPHQPISDCIPDFKKISLVMMLVSNRLPTRSVMMRRVIPLRFPENDEMEDYGLWLRVIASGYKVVMMDLSLAFTFKPEYSDEGYSGQLWMQEKRELAALTRLWTQGDIRFLALLPILGWSLLKYLRRVANRVWRKLI